MWAQLCKQNLLPVHPSVWAIEREAGSQASSSLRDGEVAQGCSCNRDFFKIFFLACFDFHACVSHAKLAEPTLTSSSAKQTGFTAMT